MSAFINSCVLSTVADKSRKKNEKNGSIHLH